MWDDRRHVITGGSYDGKLNSTPTSIAIVRANRSTDFRVFEVYEEFDGPDACSQAVAAYNATPEGSAVMPDFAGEWVYEIAIVWGGEQCTFDCLRPLRESELRGFIEYGQE
jgi:hypothetical protein